MRPHSAGRTAGLTLLETAASVAILGGVIVGLLVARARAQAACVLADEILACTRLCSARVSALRVRSLSAVEGRFPDAPGYRWAVLREEGAPDGLEPLEAWRVTVFGPSGDERATVSATIWLRPERSEEEEP